MSNLAGQQIHLLGLKSLVSVTSQYKPPSSESETDTSPLSGRTARRRLSSICFNVSTTIRSNPITTIHQDTTNLDNSYRSLFLCQ
jgi:hypothetical protein